MPDVADLHNTNEIWVTSFGNGMRLGRIQEPRPVLRRLQKDKASAVLTLSGATGQTVILSASPDLIHWIPVATNVAFTNTITVNIPATNASGFFRAQVQ